MKKVSPDQWIKIEALMDKALEVPSNEREKLVRHEAGNNPELIDQVLKMLAASDDAGEFMESKGQSHLHDVLAKMASAVAEDETERDDRRMVGPYRLVRKIGRGGMGQVYLAVRDDEAFKRYVALKVIRKGMDSEDILKRFKTERHILASLTHPNIARLLDGGFSEDGQSYFVMEYVDGEPIDKFCNENRLSLEERLKLFEKVASAVHYAHQNLVVHRDLKPGNILVTTDGSVKLLDFGIAKFLNPDLTGYTLPMTKTEVRVMTPEYASPEQVRGNSVTTASDVYQLGILLYELLTGHRPFTFETKARGEIEKIILEVPPEKPSTMISRIETQPKKTLNPETVSHQRRTPLDRLRKQLSGDLDHIVLMALRKETDRRYQSADQLLKDLENYRAGRPVIAQADTFKYRSTRFIQRNKLGVAAGLVVFLALVTVSIVSFTYATITARQRDQIALEVQKSEEVKSLVLGLFERANPNYSRGRDISVRELIDQSAAEMKLELVNQPEVLSEMLTVLGMVYSDLGEAEEGLPLIEQALQLQESLGEVDSPDLAHRMYAMGYILDEAGEVEQAKKYHAGALAMRRRLFGEQNLLVAESLNEAGVALYWTGNADSNLVVWQQAYDIRKSLLKSPHKNLVESLSNLGAVYTDLEEYGKAEQFYRDALSMLRDMDAENSPDYASNLHNFASMLIDVEAFDEAEIMLKEAIELRTTIFGERHEDTARSINYLGRLNVARGTLVEAERLFLLSTQIHIEQSGETSFVVGRDFQVLANLYETKSDFDKAVEYYLKAATVIRISSGLDHPVFIQIQGEMGQLFESLNRLAEAERAYRLAVQSYESVPDLEPHHLAVAQVRLGRILLIRGKKEEAIRLLDQAKSVFETDPTRFADRLAEVDTLLRQD